VVDFLRRKKSGSFQIDIPEVTGNAKETTVLNEDIKGRSYLRIKNTGQYIVYLAFDQTGALSVGYPLEANEHIVFQDPENTPDGKVVAAAQGGSSSLAVIFTRFE
jgi:hypothetical protein